MDELIWNVLCSYWSVLFWITVNILGLCATSMQVNQTIKSDHKRKQFNLNHRKAQKSWNHHQKNKAVNKSGRRQHAQSYLIGFYFLVKHSHITTREIGFDIWYLFWYLKCKCNKKKNCGGIFALIHCAAPSFQTAMRQRFTRHLSASLSCP